MHWKQNTERASRKGTAFLISIMNKTGPEFVKLLVVPVAVYYFFTATDVRRASMQYFERLSKTRNNLPGAQFKLFNSAWWFSFRHVLSFAQSMVDRVHTWSVGAKGIEYLCTDEKLMNHVVNDPKQGAVFLISHLGNFDMAIARGELSQQKRFNIVMDTSHTQTFNEFRGELYSSDTVRFIEPDSISPMVMMSLVERVANGEFVVIAADRSTELGDKGNVKADFLGQAAFFPKGPYIMAGLLGVPVYSVFALQKGRKCILKFKLFEKKVEVPRATREESIAKYAQKYAKILEGECLDYPLQWYNFYQFWAK